MSLNLTKTTPYFIVSREHISRQVLTFPRRPQILTDEMSYQKHVKEAPSSGPDIVNDV